MYMWLIHVKWIPYTILGYVMLISMFDFLNLVNYMVAYYWLCFFKTLGDSGGA